jgi:Methyltransferase domain
MKHNSANKVSRPLLIPTKLLFFFAQARACQCIDKLGASVASPLLIASKPGLCAAAKPTCLLGRCGRSYQNPNREQCQPKRNGSRTVFNPSLTLSPTSYTSDLKRQGSAESREIFFEKLIAAGAAVASALIPAKAFGSTFNSRTGAFLPDPDEIARAIPQAWDGIEPPLSGARALSRLDSSDDSIFYQNPRFVEHVDDKAVQMMKRYIADTLMQETSLGSAGGERPLDLLDLCASWTSHLPPVTNARLNRVAGLGMNLEELNANPSLTERIVQDLNKIPGLPYESSSFDVVLLQLSIDYLIQPLVVCQEVGRVLRPGGTVHIIFSNRIFLSKAVASWTGVDDVDRAFTVGSYLHFCGPQLFRDIRALDLSNRDKRGQVVGDPLYVVTASKA